MRKRALLWFTHDLRIRDNDPLHWAQLNDHDVLAVAFVPTASGPIQKQFYVESALEIRDRFRERKLEFLLVEGDPLREIPKWAEANSIAAVLTQDSFNSRGRALIASVRSALGGIKLRTFSNQTLIDPAKLPFAISDMPMIFTPFLKLIEKADCFSEPLDSSVDGISGFEAVIPSDAQLVESFDGGASKRHRYPFDMRAGESGAWSRVRDFIWETKAILHYEETRNGMLERDDSSKLSASLGCGCISVRELYREVKKYEAECGSNKSTEWFIYELMWRDYFKFLALKSGERFFSVHGITKKSRHWERDDRVFQDWCEGRTGADFIDANMIELKKTGWMSNRGRQNVANYLAKTLKIDWTLGAEHFERTLIDLDVEVNWGNWLYNAGVGTDPRDRVFDYTRQAEVYDTDHRYRSRWLGERGS